jgi:DNA polymerase-1
MRADAIGMFWEDVPEVRGANRIAAVMPEIPNTGWIAPKVLPNLSNAKVLSIDTETYDPELMTKGPGWARGVGHLVGVSIGDGHNKWYFPIRHEIEPETNWDADVVIRWLKHTLSNPKQPKVGANITYDIGWLRQEGVIVKGALYDIQFAEALLDEASKVALDVLGQKYLGEGKTSNDLYKWCSDYYGGAVGQAQRKNIYRTPPRLAGPYAEDDAELPLRILNEQWPLLAQEGLLDVFKMECELIYLMVDMRFTGVQVDVKAAEALSVALMGEIEVASARLSKMVGFDVNINAAASMAMAFDELDVPYGRTTKGNPSFTGKFLDSVTHPIGDLIREVRKLTKLKGTFVDSYILGNHIDERVYCQFHQLRSDNTGTRSGRFSSSDPNLQNIPSRDEILAPLIRGLFIPDHGHKAWRKYDYSQIEYRCLAHDAVGPSGENLRNIFINDPDADYHNVTQDLVETETGIVLPRKPIKNINFGLIYGMGISTLSEGLGLSKKEGKHLFSAYHKGAPYAQATMDHYSEMARNTGVVRTIMGRKSRFDLWEPIKWSKGAIALPYEQAVMKWGRVQRSASHKGLNRRLQGSAADVMKKAMHKCYYDGVFDETGIPKLTVHDELNFSDPGGKDAAFLEMQHTMETALRLRVPIKADGEIGTDWGHVKDI